MAHEALEGGHTAMLKQMAEADLAVAAADKAKADLEAKVHETSSALPNAVHAVNEKSSALSSLLPTIPQLKANVKESEAIWKVVDKSYVALSAKRDKLDAFLRDSYGPLKDGALADACRDDAMRAIGPVGRQLECEADFMKPLWKALAKAPASRSDLDRSLTAKFDEIASTSLSQLSEALAREEPAHQEAKAKAESAKVRLEAAESLRVTSAEELEVARVAEFDVRRAVRDASNACATACDAAAVAIRSGVALRDELLLFSQGPLAAVRRDLAQLPTSPVAAEAPATTAD